MLVHAEDDGELSVLAGDNELLVACNRGHYWVLAAQCQQVTPARLTEGADVAPADEAEDLAQRFGRGVRAALGVERARE